MGLFDRLPKKISYDIGEEVEKVLGRLSELTQKGYNLADDLVDQFFTDISYPRINVSENGMTVKVQIEAAGVDPRQLRIKVTDARLLTVAGAVEEEKKERDEHRVRVERKQGTFERTVALPAAVDHTSAEVVTKNGVVTITFRKQEPKTVDVTVNIE